MTDCVVNIDLTVPSSSGPDVPASGYIEFRPSKRRDLEGAIVLPDKFNVRLDENGSATVTLAPTVDGDWAWRATERIQRGRQWYFNVPDGPGPVDYDDLEEVDKDTLNPSTPMVPVWKQYVDTADAALQAAIDAVEAGDVDSVAGETGTVTAAALKTALSLPDDTEAELAVQLAAINAEIVVREAEDLALQVDVDGRLAAASNLADVADAATARTNLGLGSAATQDVADFATAEQGTLADDAAPLRSVQQHIAPRVVRDVEASPATVTLNAAADAATYNRQFIYSSAGATWPIDSGHVVTVNASGYEYNSNPGGMRRARFMCDRDRVQLYMAPAGAANTFEVYIDGKRQSSTPFAFATSSSQYITIVVPGGIHRPRLFEIVTDAGISLIATSKPGKLWKPGPPVGPKVLVVGDSYCQPTVSANTGTGYATTRTEGIYQNIAPLLGLPDVLCQGLGGTGWLRANGGSQNYRTRIPALLTTFTPDVLVVHGGGLNDLANGFTVDQVRDQVIAAMAEFRAARPNMKLVFVEGIAPPGVTPATINPQYVSVSSQARAALTETGVYWIDVATTSPWINGAGNVNAVNADGENANVYVGGDGTHLTAAGHIYVRERVAIALRRILADDGTLLNTLI